MERLGKVELHVVSEWLLWRACFMYAEWGFPHLLLAACAGILDHNELLQMFPHLQQSRKCRRHCCWGQCHHLQQSSKRRQQAAAPWWRHRRRHLQ
jgi:hypothetical protein